jgi:hypothetical protein
MAAVSKTVKRNLVFGWDMNFEAVSDGTDWYVTYYDSNGVDMYKIKLDAATKQQAKNLIAQIQTWMNQQETWSGTVVEHWQKKTVSETKSIEKWVQV